MGLVVGKSQMSKKAKVITINRAPVLTLWAAIVAQRMGFQRREALSLGKAVAGLNAQAKGRRLGIFRPTETRASEARQREGTEEFAVEVCGRPVPARNTPDGVLAVKGSNVIDPDSVQRYLENKFGDSLSAVTEAFERLAHAYKPRELAREAFNLYEQFRPQVPEGQNGWGAAGVLDLALIDKLAQVE
jgi:hypothetical protein